MRKAGRLAADVLDMAGNLVKVSWNYFSHGHCSHIRLGLSCLSVVPADFMCDVLQPGTTTDAIDKAVHKMIIDNGAYPSPLMYGGLHTLPVL